MKATKLFTMLVGSSLLFASAAFAGPGKKTLHLDKNVTVEGKTLPAGDYKVEWTGSGSDVKVNILKGKETVASASARVVSVALPNKQDGYSATTAQDGSNALNSLFFSGDKFDLEIGQSAAASTASGAATASPN